MFTEDITAIVLDLGSNEFRSGYSGEDTPRIVIPSCYGHKMQIQKQQNEQNQNAIEIEQEIEKKMYYVGDHITYRRDQMEIEPSYLKGELKNREAFVEQVGHIYKNLGVQPSDYCLLMSESSLHNQKEREQFCEIAFENFKVPNFYICKSGVLSSFSSGRSNALIIDSGAYQTYAIPVFDGYTLQRGIIKYDIGGEFLTDQIRNHIEKKMQIEIKPRYELGQAFPNTADSFRSFSKQNIAREIKEQICRVDDKSLNVGEMMLERIDAELPDKQVLQFDVARTEYSEYFFSRHNKTDNNVVPEFLNQPELMSFKGIQHMAIDSINKCDTDIKRELFQNIILTGGNSLLQGFSSKLSAKLNDVVPPNSKVKMVAYPTTTERKFSSWIGGSILASLGSFQSLWITKAEYDETGAHIIEKKCP